MFTYLGSIVSSSYVLSLGFWYSSTKEKDIIVRLGTKASKRGGELFRVSKMFVSSAGPESVLLLRLAKTIRLVPKLKEIVQLPHQNEEIDDDIALTVIGWGSGFNGTKTSLKARRVDIVSVDQKQCKTDDSVMLVNSTASKYFCAKAVYEGDTYCLGKNSDFMLLAHFLIICFFFYQRLAVSSFECYIKISKH